MRQFKILATALSAALLVAACGGGGGDGDQAPKIKFSAMVTFGDSLSDIGSYRVGPVAALGGGRFSINPTDPKTATNWTELLAAQLGLPAPCAARTGGFGVAVSIPNALGCRNYAQGGARVTDPKGNGNTVGAGYTAGPLTDPIVTQIANFAIDNGSANFSGKELVTVLAGGNDVLLLLDGLSSAATAAGQAAFGNSLVGQLAAGATTPATAAQAIGLALMTESARTGHTDASVVGAAVGAAVKAGNSAAGSSDVYLPMVAIAKTAGASAGTTYAATNGPALMPLMATAGTALAGYIKTSIVGKGAKYVAVVNVPDVSLTPAGRANSAQTQGLINLMVTTFNTALQTGLSGTAGVIIVDAYSDNRNQAFNPASYALTNVTDKACDLTTPSPNAMGSSLVCNASNVNTGDVSHYLFADSVHPTPYGYKLLAQLTAKSLVLAGWL